MLTRDDYITLIEEIRNVEVVALDDYIEKRLIPLQVENPFLVDILYKDIIFILGGVDGEEDNDLMIVDGDLVEENGDLKLTGYQTRLHDITDWLRMEQLEKLLSSWNQSTDILAHLEGWDSKLMGKPAYTPEYRKKLLLIRESIKAEKKYNTGKRQPWISRLFNLENFELKPSIVGFEIDLKKMIKSLKGK